MIFSQIYKSAQSGNLVVILAQVLFWGAIFVVITIILLKIMLETIVATKLNQTDSLTSLCNKMAGHGKIDEVLLTGTEPIFLSILDLDNFKKANDIYVYNVYQHNHNSLLQVHLYCNVLERNVIYRTVLNSRVKGRYSVKESIFGPLHYSWYSIT